MQRDRPFLRITGWIDQSGSMTVTFEFRTRCRAKPGANGMRNFPAVPWNAWLGVTAVPVTFQRSTRPPPFGPTLKPTVAFPMDLCSHIERARSALERALVSLPMATSSGF